MRDARNAFTVLTPDKFYVNLGLSTVVPGECYASYVGINILVSRCPIRPQTVLLAAATYLLRLILIYAKFGRTRRGGRFVKQRGIERRDRPVTHPASAVTLNNLEEWRREGETKETRRELDVASE